MRNFTRLRILTSLIFLIGIHSLAHAATFTVTNTSNDVLMSGSLPWAINEANITPGLDIVSIPIGGTVAMTTTMFITEDIFIDAGNGTPDWFITKDGGNIFQANDVTDIHIKGIDMSDVVGLDNNTNGIDFDNCHQVRIENCRFDNLRNAIDLNGGSGAQIDGNAFVSSDIFNVPGVILIDIETNATTSNRVDFSGNTMTGGNGLRLQGMDGITVGTAGSDEVEIAATFFNTIEATPLDIIACDDVTIDGIDFSRTDGSMGTSGFTARDCSNLTFQNNTINNHQTGATFFRIDTLLVHNNGFEKIVPTAPFAREAIIIDEGSNATVTNNSMTVFGQVGSTFALRLDNIDFGSNGKRMDVRGNTFINCGEGVLIREMDDVIVDEVLVPGTTEVHLPDNDGRWSCYATNLRFELCRNLVLEDMDLSRDTVANTTQGQGLELSDCHNALVQNLEINNRLTGINVFRSDTITIHNNNIERVADSGNSREAILVNEGSNVTITNNNMILHGLVNNTMALSLDNIGFGSNGERMNVRGNTFTNCNEVLKIREMDDVIIDEVDIPGTMEIHFPDNNGRKTSFATILRAELCRNLVIEDFEFTNDTLNNTIAGEALEIDNCDNAIIQNNAVYDKSSGFIFTNCDTLLVHNNTFEIVGAGNSRTAISIKNGSNATVTDNVMDRYGYVNNGMALFMDNIGFGSNGKRLDVRGNTFVNGGENVRLRSMDNLIIDQTLNVGVTEVHLPNTDGRKNSIFTNIRMELCDNTSIQNFDLSYDGGGLSGDGIELEGCINVNVSNNTITNRDRGIHSNNSSQVVINTNTITNTNNEAIQVRGGSNAEVRNNILTNTVTNGSDFIFSIEIDNVSNDGTRRIAVAGNTFNGGRDAMYFRSMDNIINSPTYTAGVTEVQLSPTDGREGMDGHNLRFDLSGNTTLDGYDFTSSGAGNLGIYLNSCDSFFLNDITINNASTAIRIDNGSDYFISNSNFSDFASNVFSVSNANGLTITGNDIRNSNVGGNNSAAIRLQNVETSPNSGHRLLMEDNKFSNHLNAIMFRVMDDIIVSDGTVANSHVILDTQDSLWTSEQPLYFIQSHNAQVENITIKANPNNPGDGSGIVIDDSDNATINNVSVSNKVNGLNFIKSFGNTVQNSLLQENVNGLFGNGIINDSTTVTVSNTNIVCNSSFGINANNNTTITAASNFWGANDGSSTDSGSGDSYREGTVTNQEGSVVNSTNFLINENALIPVSGRKIYGNGAQLSSGQTAVSAGNNTDFGTINTGTSLTKMFAIQNNGLDTLFIDTITSDNTVFTIANAPAYVLCEDSVFFDVAFAPTAGPNETATIDIEAEDCYNTSFIFNVEGAGNVICDIAISGVSVTDKGCPGADDGALDVTASCTFCSTIEYSTDSTNWVTGNVFSGLADGTYTVYVRDSSSHTCNASMMATIATGVDTTPPMAVCQNVSVHLDGAGNASITASDVNNGSSDNCSIQSVEISQTNFSCEGLTNFSLALDGIDDYVIPPTLPIEGISSFTIETWLHPTRLDPFTEVYRLSRISDINLVTNREDIVLYFDNLNRLAFDMWDNTKPTQNSRIVTTSGILALNTWQHIAVVFDGSGAGPTDKVKIYLDGIEQATTFQNLTGTADFPSLSPVMQGTPITFIGGFPTLNRHTEGFMDEYRVWSTGRTQQEIANNLYTEVAGQPGLLTYYRFDEGSGTVASDQLGNNDAALINGTGYSTNRPFGSGSNSNEVVLTVTDNSGNASTCIASVTLLDTIAPVAMCTDITVNLVDQNAYSLTQAEIDAIGANSTDNCPNITYSISAGTYTCADAGSTNQVTLYATDEAGNVDSCTAMVTITDTSNVCCDIAITSVTPTDEVCPGADDGEIDVVAICTSCTSIEYSIDDFTTMNTTGNFTGLADGTYTVKVRDSGDNSCAAEMMNVVVGAGTDISAPSISCNDITVDLDAAGSYTLTSTDLEALAMGSTDDCTDFSGLTITSTPSSFDCNDVAGQANNLALSFDQTPTGNGSDYVVSSNNVGITGNADRTLEFWIRMDETDVFNETIINWGDIAQGESFGFYQTFNSELEFYTFDSPNGWDHGTGHFFDEQQWYHIAVSYDGSTNLATIYINGDPAPNSTFTPPGTINTTDSPLFLATRTDLNALTFTSIDLDEVRVWDYARTQSEIMADMNIALNGNESGLVLYYDMELDGTGTTNLVDKVGSNDATLINMDPANDWIASGSPVFSGGTPVVLEVTDAAGNTSTSTCAVSVTVNTNLTVASTAVAETCMDNDDGQLTITVTGGTGPYTFTATRQGDGSTLTLSGTSPQTFMNLIADEYIIEVEDNGECSGTTTASVGASATPCCDIAISGVSVTDEVCSGADDGALDVTASCTTCSTIEYSTDSSSWVVGNMISGLADGMYTVYVRDSSDHTCNASSAGHVVSAGDTTDTDSDNVPDCIDLDDDNDGILDVDELVCDSAAIVSSTPVTITETFGAGTDPGPAITEISNSYTYSTGPTSDGFYSIATDTDPYDDFGAANNVWSETHGVGDNTGDHNGYFLLINGSAPGQEAFRKTFNIVPNSDFTVSVALINLGPALTIKPNLTLRLENSNGVQLDMSNTGNLLNNSWATYTLTGMTSADDQVDLVIISNAPAGSGNDYGVDDVSITYLPLLCDRDEDNISDSQELDSDNDGCFDVAEAGYNDPDDDGILGTSPVSVDTLGRVLGEGGYTGATNEDAVNPMAICQDITVYLDGSGMASITASDVDGGSSDNCGGVTLSIDSTNFNCSKLGANTVVLTAEDGNGNINTCNATVTVVDSIAPTAVCQDVTVYLDGSGMASITAAGVNNGSSDNCGSVSVSIDSTSFDCSKLGANTVVLTATDGTNMATCSATVTVLDNIAPLLANLPSDITISCTDALPVNTVTASDNCSEVLGSNSNILVDYSDTGWKYMNLTDTNNDCDLPVGMETAGFDDSAWPVGGGGFSDDIPFQACGGFPAATPFNLNTKMVLRREVTLPANASGMHIKATYDNGFRAWVNGTPVVDCIFLGGCNYDRDRTVVVVPDNLLLTGSNTIVIMGFDEGFAAYLDATITLSSSISGLVPFSETSADGEVANEISIIERSWAVVDGSGNQSTHSQKITILDNIDPTATCPANTVNLYLDGSGNATLAANSLGDGSSSDNCGTVTESNAAASYTCNDLGAQTVVLTADDGNGNTDTENCTVMVIDSIAPVAACTDITINLVDENTYNLSQANIDAIGVNSTDNCGTPTYSITAGQTAYDCADVGNTYAVTLRATDTAGHIDSCTAMITITDTNSVCCDISITSVTPTNEGCPNADDGALNVTASCTSCSTVEYSTDSTTWVSGNVFSGLADGMYTVYVRDSSSHICNASMMAVIGIGIDTTPPSITSCPSTLNLFATPAICTLDSADVDLGTLVAADMCGIASITHNGPAVFEVGDTTITWTVTDNNGLMTTCTQLVTVYRPGEIQGNGIDDDCDGDIDEAPLVELIELENGTGNGSCISTTDDCADTYCYGLQYTPNLTGDLSSYTAGFITDCTNSSNSVITNTSCVMNDNSNELVNCANGGVLFNSNGNTGSVSVTEGTPIMLHQICFDVPANESIQVIKDVITDITMTITIPNSGLNYTETPTFDTITVSGNTPPNITMGSIDACYMDAATAMADTTNATTAVDDYSTSISFSAIALGTCNTMIRVYATDECGITDSVDYPTTIDGDAPVITGALDITVIEGCDTLAMPAALTNVADLEALPGGMTINDDCTDDANLVLTYSQSISGTCPIIILRNYIVTDACGNMSNLNHTIHINDTTTPAINGTISPSSVEGCSAADAPTAETTVAGLEALPGGAQITDACHDSLLTVSHVDFVVPGCTITITRIYTITDVCGNSTPAVQIITVTDSTPPELTAGTIDACYASELNATTAAIGATTYNENCAGDLTYTTSIIGSCPSTIQVIGADVCGNVDTIEYVTQINDGNGPSEVGGPAESSSMIQYELDATAVPAPVFEDHCGNLLTPSGPVLGGTYQTGECSGTITYSYTYTDCAGTDSTWTYTYNVECQKVNVKVFLDGPFDDSGDTMKTLLTYHHQLPGQDKLLSPEFAIKLGGLNTPFGHPYAAQPWGYTGTLGDTYGDASAPNAPAGVTPYPSHVVDWVLVTVRENGALPANNVWQCAGWLHQNGKVTYPDGCPTTLNIDTLAEYYVVVQHRNHLAVMDTASVENAGEYIDIDFTMSNSYEPFFRFGQTTLPGGLYAMFQANGEQNNSRQVINDNDVTIWRIDQPKFGYLRGDFNLDAVTLPVDETNWKLNQGKSTGVRF